MQERANWIILFKPQIADGQRITIGAAAIRSAVIDYNKEHHIWCTKACWLRIGNNAVVALPPLIGANPLTGGDFPLSAGCVYTYIATGADNAYISVIEDASVNGIAGYLFIGRSEL